MLSDVPSKIVYDIAGTTPITDGYEITFRYFETDEVKVYLITSAGTESEVESTDYTVSNSGTTPVVKFVDDFSFGEATRLVIMRVVAYEQPADYRNGDLFDAEHIEESFDLLTAQTQQLAEEMDRALLKPKSESGAIVIPSKNERAGMLLGFDTNGELIPVLTSDIEQKLSQALEAEESTLAAKDATEEYRDETLTLRDDASAIRTAMQNYVEKYVWYADRAALKAQQYAQACSLYKVAVEGLKDRVVSMEADTETYHNAVQTMHQVVLDAQTDVIAKQQACEEILAQMQSYLEDFATAYQQAIAGVADQELSSVNAVDAAADAKISEMDAIKEDVASMQAAVASDKTIVAGDKAINQQIRDQIAALRNEIAVLKSQTEAASSSVVVPVITAEGKMYTQAIHVKGGRRFLKTEEVVTNTSEEETV